MAWGGLASFSFQTLRVSSDGPIPFKPSFQMRNIWVFEGAAETAATLLPSVVEGRGCPTVTLEGVLASAASGARGRFSAAHVSSSPRTLGSKCRWPMTVRYLPIFPMTPRFTLTNGDISSLRKPEFLVVFPCGILNAEPVVWLPAYSLGLGALITGW